MAKIEDVKVGDILIYQIGCNLVYRYQVQKIEMFQVKCVVIETPEGRTGALRTFIESDIKHLEIEK